MTYGPLLVSGLAERSDFCLRTEIRRRLLYTKTICSPFVHVATRQSGSQILPCLARDTPKLGSIGPQHLPCEIRGSGRLLVRVWGEGLRLLYSPSPRAGSLSASLIAELARCRAPPSPRTSSRNYNYNFIHCSQLYLSGTCPQCWLQASYRFLSTPNAPLGRYGFP